ncbi:MAG TPA: hypothetical protein VJU17_06410, partial [Gemmatimonadales bacterium]|nr:hypothetical protein [Gemmatimonadales bacterium]
NTDQLAPNSDEPEVISLSEPAPVPTSTSAPSFSSTFAGGIPFGTFAQPTEAFGSVLNGGKMNISPDLMLKTLAEIKARGGRVILAMAGSESYYKDAQGHFSFSLWKERVNRFRGVNLSSYVADGTVIGTYLIDEPNDPSNWNGEPIPGSMLEEMAKYSKSIWPTMNTIVRTQATYLDNFSTTYKYLDAAWAQYAERFGDPKAFLAANVAAAKNKGLALVTGLNISMGTTGKTELSAKQIESWGSALLADSYPCAFISWQYREAYMSRTDIRAAMASLAQKARSHAARACGSGVVVDSPDDPPPTTLPGVSGVALKVTSTIQDRIRYNVLTWSGAAGASVVVHRNSTLSRTIENDGRWRNHPKSSGQYTYWICETGTSRCSNKVTVSFP